MKRFIILLLILSSCKKEVYYYPSKSFFGENNPKEIIIDDLNYKEVVDSIQNELFQKKRFFIEITDFNKIYKISPLAYTGGYIKEKNILQIVDDSLWVSTTKVSINELEKHIKLHYENNGETEYLPDSYKRAFLKLNLDSEDNSEKLKTKLLKIIQVYNITNFKYKDSVNLDIMLDYYQDKIYPQTIPPPPNSLIIED